MPRKVPRGFCAHIEDGDAIRVKARQTAVKKSVALISGMTVGRGESAIQIPAEPSSHGRAHQGDVPEGSICRRILPAVVDPGDLTARNEIAELIQTGGSATTKVPTPLAPGFTLDRRKIENRIDLSVLVKF